MNAGYTSVYSLYSLAITSLYCAPVPRMNYRRTQHYVSVLKALVNKHSFPFVLDSSLFASRANDGTLKRGSNLRNTIYRRRGTSLTASGQRDQEKPAHQGWLFARSSHTLLACFFNPISRESCGREPRERAPR